MEAIRPSSDPGPLPWWKRSWLWEWPAVVALGAVLVFNRGISNLVLPLGFPIPVVDVVLLCCAIVCFAQAPSAWRPLARELAVWAWLGMAALAAVHLVSDLRTYRVMAARDASFLIEGSLALAFGLLWAIRRPRSPTLLRGLWVAVWVAAAYAALFPFRNAIREFSPQGGVFTNLPVIGTFTNFSFMTVIGFGFCVLVAARSTGRRAWIAWGLAAAHAGLGLMLQTRYSYVALAALPPALWILLDRRIALRAALSIGAGVLVLLLGATLVSLFAPNALRGRVGPVAPSFYRGHLKTIAGVDTDVPEASLSWRAKRNLEAWDSFTQSPKTILVGVGFGQPITNIRYRSGRRPASQPHNVHMTIAARMGLAGVLLWILFNAAVVARLGQAFRREADPVRFPGSWFLLVYFAGLLLATVQQWLENPSGTIPFFLLVGYGVGMAIASRPEPAPPPVASSVPPEA